LLSQIVLTLDLDKRQAVFPDRNINRQTALTDSVVKQTVDTDTYRTGGKNKDKSANENKVSET
jgi:hypothetical protein